MPRRTFNAFSVASVVALAVACGSFDAAPVAIGTDDGGSSEGGTPDAGTPDAEDAGDASPQDVRRCQGMALRESTFDKPVNFAGWTVTQGAVVSAVDVGPTPPALFAQAGVVGNGDVNNTLTSAFSLAGRGKVCIELDVRYEITSGTFTNDAYAEILAVMSSNANLFVEMRAPGFALVQGTAPVIVPGFAPNEWQHLVLRVPYGAGGQPTLEVDDFAAAVAPNTAGGIPATVEIAIGLAANGRTGTTAASRVHIDNFRFTTEL